MARLTFPDEGSRLVYRATSNGRALNSAAGAAVLVYTDDAATQIANLTTMDGTAISGGALNVDAYSRLPLFKGPNDSTDTLYVVIDGGPVVPVYARNDDRLDALLAQVNALTASSGSAVTAEAAARAAADAAETAARIASDAADAVDDAAEVTARANADTAEIAARAAAVAAEAAARATAVGDEATARAAAVTAEANARIAADAAMNTTVTANTTAVALRLVAVEHGSTAGTARPTSTLPVKWFGTVAPTNAVTNDEWYDRSIDLLKRWDGTAWQGVGKSTYPTFRGNKVGVLGDSLTAGTPLGTGPTFLIGEAYIEYAMLASGGALVLTGNDGVGGETSAQILARLATALGRSPDVLIGCMGANDIILGSIPLSTTKTNIQSFVTQCRAAGVLPLLLTLPPNSNSGQKVAYAQLNAWLRIWCQRNKVGLVDVHRLLVNPATGSYASGYDKGDGVHPTPAGMKVMGDAVWAALANMLAPHNGLGSTWAGESINLLTHGTFDAGTTTPTGWNVLNTSASFTINALAADPTLGIGNKASITVSDTGFVQFNQSVSAGYAVGDKLAFSVKQRLLGAGAGLVEAYLFFNGSTDPNGSQFNLSKVSAISAGSMYGEFTVPPGTTAILCRLRVTGVSGSSTAEFAEASLVNLTTQGF